MTSVNSVFSRISFIKLVGIINIKKKTVNTSIKLEVKIGFDFDFEPKKKIVPRPKMKYRTLLILFRCTKFTRKSSENVTWNSNTIVAYLYFVDIQVRQTNKDLDIPPFRLLLVPGMGWINNSSSSESRSIVSPISSVSSYPSNWFSSLFSDFSFSVSFSISSIRFCFSLRISWSCILNQTFIRKK